MASALPASRGPAGHDGMVSAKPEEVPKPPPELAAHILDLIVPEKRESALLLLSKNRERYPDLAPYLWWSFGTMSVLLQEIVAIYPSLSPPMLTAPASNRVCNALALLQCVASHKLTRMRFLDGERLVRGCQASLSIAAPASPKLRAQALAGPADGPFQACHGERCPQAPWRRLCGNSRPVVPLASRSENCAVPLPVPQHQLGGEALRVPSPHVVGCYRRPCQGEQGAAGPAPWRHPSPLRAAASCLLPAPTLVFAPELLPRPRRVRSTTTRRSWSSLFARTSSL